MEIRNKHIIQKQLFHLTVNDENKAQHLLNDLGKTYHEKMIPALDALFQKYNVNGKIIRIDRLEIDLGTISEKDMETELVSKTLVEMEKFFQSHSHLLSHQEKEEIIAFSSEESNRLKKQMYISSFPEEKRWMECFTFYLAEGYFPWWYPFDDIIALQEQVKIAVAQKKIAWDVQFEPARIPVVIKRLIYQFDGSFVQMIIEERTPDKRMPFSPEFIRSMQHDVFPGLSLQRVKVMLWMLLLDEIFRQGKMVSDKLQILNTFFQLVKRIRDFSYEDLLYRIEKAMEKSEINRPLKADLVLLIELWKKENKEIREIISKRSKQKERRESLEEKKNGEIDEEYMIDDEVIPKEFLLKDQHDQVLPDLLFEISDEETEELSKQDDFSFEKVEISELFQTGRDKKGDSGKEIYVKNAGIILFHPFLPSLFKNLGWVHENKYIHTIVRMKALQLLGVLSGNDYFTEHNLVLNKVLCGMDVNDPVPKEDLLNEHEKEEANKLLKSVLEHWKALKKTSLVGLIENFVRREGKLTDQYDHWSLQVERKVYDILLDKLPWGITVVKLPWMKKMIFVEW